MKPKVQPGQFWYDQRDLERDDKPFLGAWIGNKNHWGEFEMKWVMMPRLGGYQSAPTYWPERDIHRHFILDETQNVELILAKYDDLP